MIKYCVIILFTSQNVTAVISQNKPVPKANLGVRNPTIGIRAGLSLKSLTTQDKIIMNSAPPLGHGQGQHINRPPLFNGEYYS